MSELLNYPDMSLNHLDERGKELSAAIRGNYLNAERKAQVQHELGLISFELWVRYNAGEMEIVQV